MKDSLQLSIEEVQLRWTPISAWEERALFSQLALGHASKKQAAEKELAELFDPIAFEEVFKYTSRAKRNGDDFEDLTQEARIAVFDAIHSFDAARGLLQPHIWLRMLCRQHLDKVLLGVNHLVKVRTQMLEGLRKLRAKRAEFETENGREPTRLELVQELRATYEAVDELLLLDQASFSLDALTEGGTAFSEFLLDDESQDPAQKAEMNEQCLLVREVVEILPKDQQLALQAHLDGHTIRLEVLEPALAAFKVAYQARIGIISV